MYLQAQGVEGWEVLHVSMNKTKFLGSGFCHDVFKKSGKCACVVWCNGVGNSSI